MTVLFDQRSQLIKVFGGAAINEIHSYIHYSAATASDYRLII